MRCKGSAVALALVLAAACVPGSGSVTRPDFQRGDGATIDQPGLTLADGGEQDRGPLPDGQPPLSDTLAHDTLSPDSAPPACPEPPFGSSVGMSAANFNRPDCSGKVYDLHSECGKHPAIVLLLNEPS